MFEVVVVGAGPSGIGIAIILKKMGINFTVIERNEIGSSFLKWPKQMKLLTPSFFSNTFRMIDLNAISFDTSPALTLQTEHPSGHEYAAYLKKLADHFELPVQTWTNVDSVTKTKEGFVINTDKGNIETQILVWSGGEFQYPKDNTFPGSEHCIHNSLITNWDEVQGDEFLVVGGYESGMDTAINLAERKKRVLIIDKENLLESEDIDPSRTISPYTKDRLRRANANNTIEFHTGRVIKVEKNQDEYTVYTEQKKIPSKTKPILATGFAGSLSLIKELFDWEEGKAQLNSYDESTKSPGLYVTGPLLQQHDMIFCFIYKFQQRFAVVANHIAIKLSKDVASVVEEYKKEGMYLDNLSSIEDKCAC
ncbi:NAD(P)/FAD-dependent oxidoreductase [Nitrosopumilus sp.]|uniref:NAD(P)/FAD-dependent oxidoreductase n=1 Tax=Nitrosopumilus sp. TaxID=2024843 RepID=UPI00261D536C|nr:NAD(P)/FAD-dependent oxidoreductase [Nitrosopumilus sp.]